MHCGTFKCFEMHGISSSQQSVKKTEGKYFYRLIRMKEMKGETAGSPNKKGEQDKD